MADPANAIPAGKTSPDAAKILRYFALFLLAVALLAFAALVFIGMSEIRLAVSGVDGKATITSLREHSYRVGRTYGGGSGVVGRIEQRTDYYVTFRFAPDGRELQLEQPVSEGFFKDLERGKTITIRYLAGNPELNRIDPERSYWAIVVPMVLTVVFGACGWLFLRVSKKVSLAGKPPSE